MNHATETIAPRGRARPDYGIDAPGLVRTFFLAGAAALALCAISGIWLNGLEPWSAVAAVMFAVAAAYLLGMGAFMSYYSKVTKARESERLLDLVKWRGDERVLDVGCGRGLMLVGAARRLSTGRAVGIDIWRAEDQSSNNADAAIENARIEGAGDRVELQTADMRALPFADRSFDVVVSHWAVHNLEEEADRAKAISDMIRVLRPGGSLILADIKNFEVYAAELSGLGVSDLRVILLPANNAVMKALSFGGFQPAAIFARTAQ